MRAVSKENQLWGMRTSRRMQNIKRPIGERIRARRRCLGLTLAQVADAQAFSYQQLHKYETGADHAAASTLYDLALLFDVEIGHFFQGLSDEQVLPRAGADTRFLSLALTFIRLDEEDQAILIQVTRQFAGRRLRPTQQPEAG